MTFTPATTTDAALTEQHRIKARNLWLSAGGSPYALPASKSTPRRRSSDAAVSDPPPRLDLVLHARKLLRGGGAALAGSPTVNAPSIPRVMSDGACGYTADYQADGPKGAPVWIVRDLATREALACYPADEVDERGAILRLIEARMRWQARVRRERTS